MSSTGSFYASGIALIQTKTFWSALLTLIAIVAKQFNLGWLGSWAADPHTVDTILNAVAVLGTLATMVFRATAKSPVTGIITAK